MNTDLPADVAEFGRAARRRLDALGGVEFARRAERDPLLRAQAGAALAELGVRDLDVRAGAAELLAGAQLCRAAGAAALPWPVVDDLLAFGGARLALIDPRVPRVDHADLPGELVGADLDGLLHRLVPGPRTGRRLGPFVHAVSAQPAGALPLDDVALHLVLGSWRLLGAAETAFAAACDHVRTRRQFGQPLAEFQAVRFTVADADVALRGFEELAKWTTWRQSVARPEQRIADALALRLHAVDRTVAVLRTSHQLFGAVGFCDETDVSVIDRLAQPTLRLPVGAEGLVERLFPVVRAGDLEALFP